MNNTANIFNLSAQCDNKISNFVHTTNCNVAKHSVDNAQTPS